MSEEKPAIARSVAIALFRDLSGFQGYPKPGPGEDHFIRAFQNCAISVDHARAVIASFTGKMPTIQDIRDSASSLREKFEVSEDQRIAWEKEYGKPQPFKIEEPIKQQRTEDALWKAIMQREEFRGPNGRKKLQAMSWTKLATVARELGFEEHAQAWERSERHAG